MRKSFLNSRIMATIWYDRKRGSSKCPTPTAAASTSPLFCGQVKKDSFGSNFYQDVFKAAREKFTHEITFHSIDKDISLAKALLYIAAEDEAFMAFHNEMDAHSRLNGRKDVPTPSIEYKGNPLEFIPLAGKNISEWLTELDAISRKVEAELVPRDTGCHLVEVIEAVNIVLFRQRGFKRLPLAVEPKCS